MKRHFYSTSDLVPRSKRGAFTLAELVVSIGVLVLMISLAGQVMTLSVRSTGQAKALTEVNQLLRAAEQTIREDLRNVEPGQSMILIQGNPINAHWTEAEREIDADKDALTGYPHTKDVERTDPFEPDKLVLPRADILMIFTAQRSASYVDPSVSADIQQVVYGHAELGEYVPNSSAPDGYRLEVPTSPVSHKFPFDHETKFAIPARQWHLARRSVLLIPSAGPSGADPRWANDPPEDAGIPIQLDTPALLEGQIDIVANYPYDEQVLTPSTLGQTNSWPFYWPLMMFDLKNRPFARSRMDLTPPPAVANRLGHYFLPHCASFKVEWALNPGSEFVGGRLDGEREVFWFDPGALPDPNNTSAVADTLASLQKAIDLELEENGTTPRWQHLNDLMTNSLGGTQGETYSLEGRFRGFRGLPDWRMTVKDGFCDPDRTNLHVFTARRRDRNQELIPEDVFPTALRITIDVYDGAKRLERPIRHVIVAPIGS